MHFYSGVRMQTKWKQHLSSSKLRELHTSTLQMCLAIRYIYDILHFFLFCSSFHFFRCRSQVVKCSTAVALQCHNALSGDFILFRLSCLSHFDERRYDDIGFSQLKWRKMKQCVHCAVPHFGSEAIAFIHLDTLSAQVSAIFFSNDFSTQFHIEIVI